MAGDARKYDNVIRDFSEFEKLAPQNYRNFTRTQNGRSLNDLQFCHKRSKFVTRIILGFKL